MNNKNDELEWRLKKHKEAFNLWHIDFLVETKQMLETCLDDVHERINFFNSDKTIGYSEFYRTESISFSKTADLIENFMVDLEELECNLINKQTKLK